MAAGEKGRAALWHLRAAEWAGMSDSREYVRNWRLVRELAPSVTDAKERAASLGEAQLQPGRASASTRRPADVKLDTV